LSYVDNTAYANEDSTLGSTHPSDIYIHVVSSNWWFTRDSYENNTPYLMGGKIYVQPSFKKINFVSKKVLEKNLDFLRKI